MPIEGSRPEILLRVIARELRRRGLEVREYNHGYELVEIIATNPRDIMHGRATVGYDGHVTWEYIGNIETQAGAEEIRDLVIALLANDLPGQQQ
jgi:hypothetical protein